MTMTDTEKRIAALEAECAAARKKIQATTRAPATKSTGRALEQDSLIGPACILLGLLFMIFVIAIGGAWAIPPIMAMFLIGSVLWAFLRAIGRSAR